MRPIKIDPYSSGADMSKIERLKNTVAKVCNLQRFGGKCCVSRNDTVVLYDYDEWNDSMQDKIKTRFPNVSITCTNDRASVSGLVVVFVLSEGDMPTYFLLWHLFVNILLAFALSHVLLRKVCLCGCTSLHSNLLMCDRI